MKYFYATSSRVPGIKAHCSQIAQMCRSFLNSGADLELIIPERSESTVYRNKSIEEWYGFDREIPLEKLSCVDYISGSPAGLPKRFYSLAYNLMVWTFNRSLIRFLKMQEKPFILYSRDIYVFQKLIKGFPATKKIIELHLLEEKPGSTQNLENNVFGACDGIIVVTSLMKEMLVKRGIAPYKVLVEPNGVDEKAFPGLAEKQESRQKLNLPLDKKIVLFMGNFHALGVSRGLETIVQAASTIIEKHEETLFVFVGGAAESVKTYKEMFNETNVQESSYMFFGRQPYAQMHLWLGAADVLVHPLPSHPVYDKITSPLKVFEYMTSGRPMVVSNLPSLREVLVHEKNVLFVPPSNVGAFAEAIIRLFDEPILAERLAEQAREDVKFRTWDSRAQRILNWIESID